MAMCRKMVLVVLFASVWCLSRVIEASEGDADPLYNTCIQDCEQTGCVGSQCFHNCNFTSDTNLVEGQWYLQEPLYVKWKQWDCRSDCRYHCMLAREEERKRRGEMPVKYHGKWPFQRLYGIEEPVSVALSTLNLAMQFHGWISFCILMYYKLPMRSQEPCYEYTGLWHIYGILAMNSWFWIAVFHSRDFDLTEKLSYSSTVALVGFNLVLAILRAFNVTTEASRIIIAAPLLGFLTTHILYLNFYNLNYGLNMIVCAIMATAELLLWAVWAGVTRHPARMKVWLGVFTGAVCLVLKKYDFPPYKGMVDSTALWHAATVPLTHICWSFAKEDAEFSTIEQMKKQQ